MPFEDILPPGGLDKISVQPDQYPGNRQPRSSINTRIAISQKNRKRLVGPGTPYAFNETSGMVGFDIARPSKKQKLTSFTGVFAFVPAADISSLPGKKYPWISLRRPGKGHCGVMCMVSLLQVSRIAHSSTRKRSFRLPQFFKSTPANHSASWPRLRVLSASKQIRGLRRIHFPLPVIGMAIDVVPSKA